MTTSPPASTGAANGSAVVEPLRSATAGTASVATLDYLLRIADTCLILSQRLAEWCGHAPVLEEDIAIANMALDLLGQARALLSHVATLEGRGRDEDRLAFLREEREYRNVTLVELPNGAGRGDRDFAILVVRNTWMATFLRLLWERLVASSDGEVAAIAGKAVKEARYHEQHAAEWLVRLADGTDESRRRVEAARERLWNYVAELFDSDAIDEAASTSGLGPRWSDLRAAWTADLAAVYAEAGLAAQNERAFRSHGKVGRHSEHLGYMLTELQYLQRTYPGGTW